MSKTRKLSQREKRIYELELKLEQLTSDNIALKTKVYDLLKERESFIEDLELLRDLHTIPANLQTQAR